MKASQFNPANPSGKPFRLLMTTDTVGGVWNYTMDLIATLAAPAPCDTEVLLVTMGALLSASQREQAEQLSNLTLVETEWRLEWMDAPWADVDAAGAQLLELQADFQPDLVHLNGFAHGALPWQAPVVIVAHSCVFSWWKSVFGELPPGRYGEYRRRVANGLKGADLVVAPTRSMLASLAEHYEFSGPAQVLHNGRNPAAYAPGGKKPLIMAAGRLWDQAKNFELLDRIAPRLPWPVFVAGNSSLPDGSQKLLPNLNYLGNLAPSLLAQYLGTASIYASPALYEPFGLSILEGALCGCALVLGDLPSLRELWEGAALFADPRAPEAVAKAISTLIENPGLRRDMGEQALARAHCYSSQAMGPGYLSIYRGLCLDRAKRTPPNREELVRAKPELQRQSKPHLCKTENHGLHG